jgi:hypothetical protein
MTALSARGPAAFTCMDAARLVCEERDRALIEAEQEDLVGHLQTCTCCQAARRQFMAVFRDLDELLGRNAPS